MRVEDKSYQCQVCDRHFCSKNSLKVHSESHDTLKKYNCKDCGASFHTQGSYYVHIRRHGTNSIVCHYCGKVFYHKDKFKCHLRTHTGYINFKMKKLPFVTSGKKPKRERNDENEHGERPYNCKQCPKKFTSRDNLKRHDMLVHKNDHDFCCTICMEKFVFYQNFLDHMKLHRRERTFHCEVCKKCLKSKSQLMRHMRTHTGNKPYTCDLCSTQFSDSSNRNRHMKNHSSKTKIDSSQSGNLKGIIPSQNEIIEGGHLILDLSNTDLQFIVLVKIDLIN